MSTIVPPSTRKKPGEFSPYVYKSLNELKPFDDKTNFYGVLKCFNPAKRTRGTDWSVHFILIDPSLGDDHAGINVVWFHPQPDCLPRLTDVGDIVRCHRVQVKTFNGELQVVSHKRMSSVTCFSGNVDDPLAIAWASADGSTFTDKDKEKVAELRQWASSSKALELERLGRNLLALSDLPRHEGNFALICQILQVRTIPGCTPPKAFLRVWDGTAPSRSVKRMFEVADADRSTVCSDAPDDFAVDITVFDINAEESEASLQPGDLISLPKLRMKLLPDGDHRDNATCPVELTVHTYSNPNNEANFSKATAADCPEMMERIESIVQSRASPRQVRCMQSSCTIAGNPWLQFSTVAEVKESEVPGKFRLRCSVRDYLPRNIADMAVLECRQCHCQFSIPPHHELAFNLACTYKVSVDSSASLAYSTLSESTSGSGGSTERELTPGLAKHCGLWLDPKRKQYFCPRCSPKGRKDVALHFMFRFALLLGDESGKLVARCTGKEAEEFFGLQACDLQPPSAVLDALKSRMAGLLKTYPGPSQAEGEEDCPLFECCLKGYHSLDGPCGKATNDVMYRLFDTAYVPEVGM